jgi:hypothetical protein
LNILQLKKKKKIKTLPLQGDIPRKKKNFHTKKKRKEKKNERKNKENFTFQKHKTRKR